MLDWQAAHWGKGIRDVEYFLVDALLPPIATGPEREVATESVLPALLRSGAAAPASTS